MIRRAVRRLPAACAAVAVVGLAIGAGPASATTTSVEQTGEPTVTTENAPNPATQFLTISMDPIGEVSWQNARPVPVEVTIEASRAVSGVLEVADQPEGGATTTWEFDLDLAAGSTARLPVTLMTGWNGINSSAVFRSGSESLASARLQQMGNGEGSDLHIAVLGIDDPPRRVTELGSDRPLPTFPLTSDLRALDGASTLVVTPTSLRELGADSTARIGIDTWIQGGGQLVVDGSRESLEARYHRFPTANPDRFDYGAGSILYDEGWRDGVPLGGYVGSGGLAQLVESQGLGSGSGGELALLAGLALPSARVIGIVLIGYALVAGPLLFIGIGATGRHHLIWTVLPGLALVVAAGILVVGFVDRRSRSDAHITIVEVNEVGSRATTDLLVGSGFGGNRELETPEGWHYLGQGRTSGQRPIQLRVGRTTTAVGIEMPSGSNAVVRMSGVAPSYDGMLSIDGIEADAAGVIHAEVTNSSPVALEEAVAFLGNARAEIGALPAGETIEIEIEPDVDSTRTMRELLLWPRVEQQWNEVGAVAVPTDDEAVTAAGTWTEWRVAQGMTATPENVLGVAAWTDELPSPIVGSGQGRTALFARTNVPAGVSASTGFATVARIPAFGGDQIFDATFSGYPEDLRITIGPDTDPGDLALDISNVSSAVGVLVQGEWKYLELPRQGDALIQLPTSAVIDGEIRLRSFQPDWAWGNGATVQVVAETDGAEPAVLGDTIDHRANLGGPMMEGGIGGGQEFEVFEVIEVGVIDPEEPYVHTGDLPQATQGSFMVTLEEGQRLVATMRSARNDSYLRLLDEDGEALAENDDFGQRVDSQIVFDAPSAGTYEVVARDLGGQAINYELTLELG